METSAAMVQSAVEKAAVTYAEWFANGDPSWHESKTRHAFVAPIIRALGWDTADRKVCYPEWRYKNKLRVDYALFPRSTARDFATGMAVPSIILEVKPVYRIDTGQRREHGQAIGEEDIDQLQKYVDAEPGMNEGLAPSSRTAAYGCCTFSEKDVAYVTSTPVWQTLSGLMRPLTPKRFTRPWAVSIGDVRFRSLQARNHLHFNGTKKGGNVQGHAPSNSDVGAMPTKHFVIQTCACGF